MPRPHEIRTKPYKVISREVPPLRRKTGVIPALPPRMWRIPNIYPATYLFVDSPYTIHKQITLPHTAPSFPYYRNALIHQGCRHHRKHCIFRTVDTYTAKQPFSAIYYDFSQNKNPRRSYILLYSPDSGRLLSF